MSMMEWAERNPICTNISCQVKHYARQSNESERNMIASKEPKRYVLIRDDGEANIIDTGIVEFCQGPYFDKEKDRIYELGAEVEIKVTVEVKKKTAYRENASGYRTPFENRD